ncbi:hypothetical protein OBE_05225 [human gut metagenome]|uniref:Uncharacterized protein n=1 Tax=human gut metagenome TaxID=408170 RepID=K1TDM7_9ZZZZ
MSFTFLEVFAGMIADAWYAVKEYHLRLGPKSVDGTSSNLLERAVNKISENVDVKNDESRDIIIEKIKCNSKCVNSEMQDLAKNVPYRLLGRCHDNKLLVGGGVSDEFKTAVQEGLLDFQRLLRALGADFSI